MPLRLFQRYCDLQAYVGWTEEDRARVKNAAPMIDEHFDSLIKDFYEEIQRHPDAAKVITGGEVQIARLMESLKLWLRESMEGRSDVGYVVRRWNIGLRHAEIGLNPAFTAAAMARLRNGILEILGSDGSHSAEELLRLAQSFNKLLDLDLSVIQDAYESEYLRREKLAERERSELKFSLLVEAAAGLVLIVLEDQTIAYVSPYCADFTGYSKLELLGQSLGSLLTAKAARLEVSEVIANTLKGIPAQGVELPIAHRDGQQRWYVWNSKLLEDYEGQVAVLLVGQDYTERRNEQERMLRSERLAGIGQMITGIAHESRNALQRIQSCTEMLEFEIESNERAMQLVRRLQGAQDSLLHLFDEVRNYAAPIQLEHSTVRLESTWREAWNTLENARRGRDAVIVESTDGVETETTADRYRLLQVFRNLMENSLAACSDPVEIHIGCRPAQVGGRSGIAIRLRDNGPGLSPEAKRSVFEPYFTTKTKGTGLGMAIAKRIIEIHGGKLELGEDKGPGAEFIITLPKGFG
jgi:two-component system sensor kinase FixL